MIPLAASTHAAKAIASLAADARFVGFTLTPDSPFPRKQPHSKSRAGVGADTPIEDTLSAGDLFSDAKPPGDYWGVRMHHPIIQKGYHLMCVDLDAKRSNAPQDIRMQRLVSAAKQQGHLYERSLSMKGAHIWVMAKPDPSLPAKIDLGNGQEIEIFGNHPTSPRASVLLSGIELSGTLKSIESLRDFLTAADIDPDFIPEDTRHRVAGPQDSFEKIESKRVKDMLSYLRSDIHHDDWVRICMAAKSAGGTYDDIRAWSEEADSFDAKVFDAKWRSWTDKPGGVGLGTLRYIARSAGWEPEYDIPEFASPANTDILVPLDESFTKPISTVIKNVLPADGLGILWAPPASFKSFIATDWLLSIASGTPWQGNKTIQGEVWLIAGEGHAGLAKRVKAWRSERNVTTPIKLLHSRNAIILDDEDGTAPGLVALLGMIQAGHRPSVICIDTLSRSMSGDESSTRDAARYIQAVGHLQTAMRNVNHDCCILMVHHARKTGDALRGSSVLLAAADFVYQIERVENTLDLNIFCDKWKDDDPPKSINMEGRVVDIGIAEDNHGDMVGMTSLVFWTKSQQVIEQDRQNAEMLEYQTRLNLILNEIRKSGGKASRNDISAALMNLGLGIRKADFLKVIAKAIARGDLSEEGSGRYSKVCPPHEF